VNTPTQGQGALASALDVSTKFARASSQACRIADAAWQSGMSALTFEFVVQLQSLPTYSGGAVYYTLVSKCQGSSSSMSFDVEYIQASNGGTRYLEVELSADGGGGSVWDFNVGDLSITAGTHLCFTWNGSSSQNAVRCYVNGVDVGNANTWTGTVGASIYDSSEGLSIAAFGYTSPSGDYFDGRISDFAMYNSTLSARRVAAHYTAAALVTYSNVLPVGPGTGTGANDNIDPGNGQPWQFTANQTGTVAAMAIYVRAGFDCTSVRFAVYADSGDQPTGNKIGPEVVVTAANLVTGWNYITGFSAPVVSGTKYWACVLPIGGTVGTGLLVTQYAATGGLVYVEAPLSQWNDPVGSMVTGPFTVVDNFGVLGVPGAAWSPDPNAPQTLDTLTVSGMRAA